MTGPIVEPLCARLFPSGLAAAASAMTLVVGSLAIAAPALADSIAASGATVAGAAAMAPPREGTVVPGSIEREQAPDILTQPALPAAPPLREARPESHAPSAAELKLGVPLRCEDPAGFFPHIGACKLPWHAITPIVPAVIETEPPQRAKAASLLQAPARERGLAQPVTTPPAAASPNKVEAAKAVAAAEPEAHATPSKGETRPTPPKRSAGAAPPPAAPAPPRSVTVALPAAPPAPPKEVAEPPRQELAAAVAGLSHPPERAATGAPEIAWSAPRLTGALLSTQSRQVSSEGAAAAVVVAACNTHDKQFSLSAALVNAAGDAVIPLTERMQIGDAAMQPAYFHTELAFNKLVLTRGYGGAAISEASANVLLAAKHALYEIKTNQGTVAIKIAAADGNLRKVLQACQSRE